MLIPLNTSKPIADNVIIKERFLTIHHEDIEIVIEI